MTDRMKSGECCPYNGYMGHHSAWCNAIKPRETKKRDNIAELHRKAALWDAINLLWSFPGKTLEDVLRQYAAELAIPEDTP